MFTGDGAQLPPVGAGPDKYLTSPKWREQHGVPFFELTEPMRQAGGSAILRLATLVREGGFESLADLNGVGGLETPDGWVRVVTAEEMEEHARELVAGLDGDPYLFRVLAYRNAMTRQVNEFCRGLHKPDTVQWLVAGERLLMQAPLVEPDGSIAMNNGQMVEVERSAYQKINLSNPDGKGSTAVGVWVVSLRPVQGGESYTANVVDPATGEEAYGKWCAKWKKHCMAERKREVWAQFYAMDNTIAKVARPYASTVHKAQGATCGVVALMWTDIDSAFRIDPASWNPLLYTAITRASKGLYIVVS